MNTWTLSTVGAFEKNNLSLVPKHENSHVIDITQVALATMV